MNKPINFRYLAETAPREPGRPSRWVIYQDGLCTGCQALCCTLPVEVTIQDLLQLNLLSPDETQRSFHQLTRLLKERGVIEAGVENSRSFILRQTDSGVCRYLGADRRCTIYDNRPEVCRSFPSIGPRPGYCPANPLKQPSRKDRP